LDTSDNSGGVVLAVITPRGSMVTRESIKDKLTGKRLIPEIVPNLDSPQEQEQELDDTKGSPTVSTINGDSPSLGSAPIEDDVKMTSPLKDQEPTSSEPNSPTKTEGEFLLPSPAIPLPHTSRKSNSGHSGNGTATTSGYSGNHSNKSSFNDSFFTYRE